MILKVNMAMTLDGKVMRPEGKWYGLTSAEDRLRMDLYRREAQVLILGRNSVVNDDPVVVPRNLQPGERPPLPVLICRHALPPADRRIFRQAIVRPLLLIAADLDRGLDELARVCDIEILSPADLTPSGVLQFLATRSFERALLEGGPRLNYSFFREDLVDFLYLTVVPYVIGQRTLPAILDGEEPLPDFDRPAWELIRTEQVAGEIFLQYRRNRRET